MRQERGGPQAGAESLEHATTSDLESASAQAGPTEVWAVASGKGGVGRSFLTANLGCVLARDVGPVVVADLDFSGGNLHTFLGQPAGPIGVDSFLQRQVDDLSAVARAGEVPGLSFIQGAGSSSRPPNGRSRLRLLRAFRRSGSPFALLDLESGSSSAVLDFFITADRPILVVLPEPAAVENAHRFIRRVYARQLERLARARGVDGQTFRALVGSESWKPNELLTRLERLEPGLGQYLQAEIARFRIYLVLNQVRHVSDVGVGQSLKSAVQSYFGISVRFVGAIRYDTEAWWAVRRRRVRVRESSGQELGVELDLLVRNLLQDQEVEPPDGAAALFP